MSKNAAKRYFEVWSRDNDEAEEIRLGEFETKAEAIKCIKDSGHNEDLCEICFITYPFGFNRSPNYHDAVDIYTTLYETEAIIVYESFGGNIIFATNAESIEMEDTPENKKKLILDAKILDVEWLCPDSITVQSKDSILEWLEYGGVLNCYPRPRYPHYYEVYIMDDAEFEELFEANKNDTSDHRTRYKDDYARLLCENALNAIGVPEEITNALINW